MSTAQSLVRVQQPSFEFSQEQRQMILSSFLNGATEAEASVLMELARARRLNPITGQVHFVKRWNHDRQREVWAAQVGIDGLRAIAERTGLYDGQDEPEFSREPAPDGKSALLCRVRVYRKDWSRPAVGVAYWSEYAQKRKDGSYTRMWAEKPRLMLAKCAEALALRRAFPEDISGLYTEDEAGDIHEAQVAPTTGRAEQLKAKLQAKLAPAVTTVEAAPHPSPPPMVVTPPTPPPPTRRMVIQDAAPEPPPPTDADAPYDVVTGEVADDKPQLPPPATSPVVMQFGSGKGKPLAELSRKDLAWYAKVLAENVADPEKERFRQDNEEKLLAIQGELSRR